MAHFTTDVHRLVEFTTSIYVIVIFNISLCFNFILSNLMHWKLNGHYLILVVFSIVSIQQ